MKLMKYICLGLLLVLFCSSAAYADSRPEAIIGVEGDLMHVITSALWFVKNMGIFGVGAVIYLLPTLIALIRSHNKLGQIAALNIFLGWLVIGWIGGLIWSLTKDLHPQKFLDRFGSTA
jgi:hypothetical protein